MKRGRDQTPEEEPLSKRINNLHLDGSGRVINGSGPVLLPPSGHPTSSFPTSDSVHAQLNNNLVNGMNNNNPAGHTVVNGMPCPTVNGLITPEGIMVGHAGISEDMIARRELPDSLSVSYPNINPTNNEQYFSFNRTLHHLHIERLRRMGKI